MNNYEFCARYAALSGAREVLDYGCGRGEIIQLLLSRGINAHGCETFYEGGAYPVPPELANSIRGMERGIIPFPDQSFDLVINNQVMEHVQDLDLAVSEIRRVLRPDGSALSLFPDSRIWREGHCGIPFLHWFPAGSAARVYYAAALNRLGMGHFKDGKRPLVWARDFCEWLDRWTVYRSYEDIMAAFERHFLPARHIEDVWLDCRLPIAGGMPPALKRWFTNRAAGMVFVSQARPQPH